MTRTNEMIVAVEESDSTVGFYTVESGEEIARLKVGYWPHELAIHGNHAYVTNFGIKDYDEQIGRPGASISEIDLTTLCETRRFYTFRTGLEARRWRAPHGVKVSPDGAKLYVNVETADRMLVFDLKSDDAEPSANFALQNASSDVDELSDADFPLVRGTHNFEFAPDGKALWISSGPNGLSRCPLDMQTGVAMTTEHPEWPYSSVRGVIFTKDGKLLASCVNEIIEIDPAASDWLATARRINNEDEGYAVGQFLYSAIHPDDRHILAPAVWESAMIVIDRETGACVNKILLDMDPIHVRLSKDGTQGWVSHGRSKTLIELDLSGSPAEWAVRRRIVTRGGPNGIALATAARPARAKSLRFGCCLPLSGPNASEGRQIRLGYEFWREEVNSGGGLMLDGKRHEVTIDYRDTRSDAQNAGTLAAELLDSGVRFMLGNYPTPENIYASEVADARGVPFVTATGAGSIIYQQGRTYVFGIMTPARLYLAGTIDAVLSRLGAEEKTVAIASCADPAAQEDAFATAVYARDKGFAVVAPDESNLAAPFKLETRGTGEDAVSLVTYPHQHGDFAPLAALFRARFPSLALFLQTGHMGEAIALSVASKQEGFSPLAMGMSVGPALAGFRNALDRKGVSPVGLIGAAQWMQNLPDLFGHDRFGTPENFARAFFERYSAPASYFSAGATAVGLVYEDALRRAGTAEPKKVRDALAQTDLKTFFAHVSLSDDTDPPRLNSGKPIYTIQVERGADRGFTENLIAPDVSFPFAGWGNATEGHHHD